VGGDLLIQTRDVAISGSLTDTPSRGGWQLAAAQTRGSSHEACEEECQDAYHVTMVSPHELIITIADGAGAARLARIGASIASHHATDYVCRLLACPIETVNETNVKAILHSAMIHAKEAIQAEAAARQTSSKEFATTLILLIARPEFVAVAHVGDGATVIADQSGKLIGLTMPPPSNYINETTFLTSSEALAKMQLVFWNGYATRLAVFSDGLQLLSLQWPQRVPYEPFFSPLFRFIGAGPDEGLASQELATFLKSERIRSRTNDDLTLVLASNIN
jgi:Protein phosphatase 2C